LDRSRRLTLEVVELLAADVDRWGTRRWRREGISVGEERGGGHDLERRAGWVLAVESSVEGLVDGPAHDGAQLAGAGVDGDPSGGARGSVRRALRRRVRASD